MAESLKVPMSALETSEEHNFTMSLEKRIIELAVDKLKADFDRPYVLFPFQTLRLVSVFPVLSDL